MNRREFIAVALAAVAQAETTEPHANFPSNARDRLAVSSYPFRSLISTMRKQDGEQSKAGMSLAEFAKTIVSEFHVTGIEPWSHHFSSIDHRAVSQLAVDFAKAGVHVVNIPVDANVDLCSAEPEKREAAQLLYRRWIDAAGILGSPGIRVHLPPEATSDDRTECAARELKALAEYGAQGDIVVNLENDDPRTEDPFRIVKVIERANTPFLRALPDFCNSMQIKDDPQYNYSAMRAMFPHAYNISHVKDMETGENGKVYHANVDAIFAIAKKSGYRGYFSMEWEGEGDPYKGTRALIAQSIRDLS